MPTLWNFTGHFSFCNVVLCCEKLHTFYEKLGLLHQDYKERLVNFNIGKEINLYEICQQSRKSCKST